MPESIDPTMPNWSGMWKENKIGFHRPEVNDKLLAFYEQWTEGVPAGSRVLVPLCGKTVDLMHLADKAHHVVGVEWVPEAVNQFWTDTAALPLDKVSFRNVGDHEVSTAETDTAAKSVGMVRGDFFSIDKTEAVPSLIGNDAKFDLIWDRAALVAIPPHLRDQYSQVEANMIRPGGRLLLVTYTYDKVTPESKDGPPHSVPVNQVLELYGRFFNVQHLVDEDQTSHPSMQRMAANGWANVHEHVFLMTRK
eukprot:comp23500_c0_seq1/m.39360 comp23500_c0_seq1/g.39360  ORF comp23500_c0_seq1/g.39360 comp23500_c0_seq1/m.39360 type:complete len:250 (-) comp23500_c0_seq1:165-914(-)